MRQSKYKIRIGDVLYEASFMYRKIIEWKIVDIFIEDYLGGTKPVFTVLENGSGINGRATKYLSDVLSWYDTKDEAEEALKKKLDACPMWRDMRSETNLYGEN